jgi:2'-hydroxyisoflavone reductase
MSAKALKNSVGQYVFISTLSVYKSKGGTLSEDSELNTISDPTTEEVNAETYGGLKVLCEEEVLSSYPDNSLIIRPGVIVGAQDPTDRFTYWVERAARGGEILTPAPSDRKVEFIDARDLAEFIVSMIVKKQHGIYNTVDSSESLTLERLLSVAAKLFDSSITIKWADPEFLKKHEIASWSDLPLCLPNERRYEEWTDCSAARAQGLKFRALETIIRDTYQWSRSRGDDYQLKAGLSVEKEAATLKALAEI